MKKIALLLIIVLSLVLSSCENKSEYVIQFLDKGEMVTVITQDRGEFNSLLDSLSQEGIKHWTN